MEATIDTPAITPPAGSLVWGVKASLLRYISGMSDGRIGATAPASPHDGQFLFPPADAHAGAGEGAAAAESGGAGVDPDPLRFVGAATLTGHGGMLRLVFEDPWLEPAGDAWRLTIVDPYEAGERMPLAAIDRLTLEPDGRRVATGTRLTTEGGELFFFGPYTPGTELDDPVVLPR